ncbi:MAG: carbohydrate binding family 9 domain-containing protein [Candidatus Sabulitectum sp.]|nr:carbohydrate binding family 9 domain-containing protein [Candidatus Sabulitectum sp.]
MWQLLPLVTLVVGAPAGSITARRTETAPSIDGYIDDAVWAACSGETCELWQFAPDYGESMSQPTTIKVLYDDACIYFAFFMFDSLPDQMTPALTPRDNYINGEWIAVLLDTWSDGKSAFSFETSLANSQMDARLNEHGGWDYGWDAVWESGTARHANGWSSEMAVPLSCLRFPDTDSQVWSINFQRILSRTAENGWYNLSASQQMADIPTFPDLVGIEGVKGSLGMELRPYTSGRYYDARNADETEATGDIGLDIKTGLTSGITADFTINPDFGQIEADESEMNLGHFELFLREKRPFFMERSDLFDMPFNLFYSRRVGAVGWNGDVIPILGGAKITGSVFGGYSFGFLNAVTGRVWEDDTTLVETAANFGIFRGVKQFDGYSYLGISAVSKDSWEQEGFETESNRAFALDGAVELAGNHLISGSAARSWNTGVDEDGAYRFGFERIRSTLGYWVNGTQVDENFNVNGTGFTTMTGFRSGSAGISKTFRPEETFSTFSLWGRQQYTTQIDGETLENSTHAEVNGTFKNGWNFTVSGDYSGDFFDPYEGPDGKFYDDHASVFAGGGSNPYEPFRFWAGTGGGQYDKGGTYSNVIGNMRYLPVPVLEASISGNWFRTFDTENYNWEPGAFDNRSTEWKSVTFRLAYMFNPEMNLRFFSQYSNFNMEFDETGELESDELRANMLFAWQYLPGSMFYLLGETVFSGDGNGDFGDPDLGVYAKLTWYLPI